MRGKKMRGLRQSITAFSAILLTWFGTNAHASTYTWANTSTDWSTPTDWNPNGVPTSGDVVLFNLGAYSAQPSLSAASSASGLWDTGSGTVSISGNTLTLFGTAGINGNAAAGIEMDPGAGALTINSALALGTSQTWINNANPTTGPLTLAGGVNINGNTLTVGGSGDTTFSGVVSGFGGLTVAGPGLVWLTNSSNSFNATTTISGGTLAASTWDNNNNDDSALGIGNYIVFNGGTFLYEGAESPAGAQARYLTVSGSGSAIVATAVSKLWPSSLAGSGSLTIDCAAAGQFLCVGPSTCSGTLSITGGELQARGAQAYGTATIVIDGGSFGATNKSTSSNIANNIVIESNPPVGPALEFHDLFCQPTFSGAITLDNSACAFGAGNGNNGYFMTFSGLITGSGGLNLLQYSATGAAPVYIAGNQSNTFTGPTLLTGSLQGYDDFLYLANTSGYALSGSSVTFAAVGRSRLAIAAPGQQIAPAATMTFLSSGGTNMGYFQLEGYSQTIGGLDGTSGFGIVEASESSSVANATLTLDGTGSYSFNGTLRDHNSGPAVLSLIMAGSGMQTLSGSNTYSGGTTISGGTLAVTGAASLGAAGGAVAIGPGTLEIMNGFSESRNISLSTTAATIEVNPSVTYVNTGSFSGNGWLNLAGSGTLDVAGSGSISGRTNVPSGTLVINGPWTTSVVNITLNPDGSGQGSGQLAGSGTIDAMGDNLYYNSTMSSTFAGSIVGGNGIEVDGGTLDLSGSSSFSRGALVTAGELILSGSNSYTGGTVVSGGTLMLTNSDAIEAGTSLTVGNESAFATVTPALSPAITPVPEPGTLVLAAFGLWSAAIYCRYLK